MKWIVLEAAILGMTALMLDAFFAHGLKTFLGAHFSESAFHALATAARYQIMAALFLLILFVLHRFMPSMWTILSSVLVSAGVILFCLTIYLRYLFGFSALTSLAPLGGIAFMLSFLALVPLVFP